MITTPLAERSSSDPIKVRRLPVVAAGAPSKPIAADAIRPNLRAYPAPLRVIGPDQKPKPNPAARGIYRWFFLAAIAVVLTAGATWGAAILWQIAVLKHFTSISLYAINAHGSAQVYGWVGLFIMGFAYQAFPRFWGGTLAWPRLSYVALIFCLEGILLTTIGMPLVGSWHYAPVLAVAGGFLHLASAIIFAAQMVQTFRKSSARLEPYIGFIFAATFWFVAMSALDAWHNWTTTTAPYLAALLWHVATYQAPLRDMQIHGLILTMILGVSIRTFPDVFGLPKIGHRRAWTALAMLTLSVAAECVIFVVYRWTSNHVIAAFLFIPWVAITVACLMVALPWKLWRKPPIVYRSAKFVRAGYAWLAVSLAMLLMFPAYMHAAKLPFSHAYYGAIRHAITVGFASMMIMGFASKMIPRLNGIDVNTLSPLWGPFILINAGCAIRVSTQVLTDWNPVFYHVIGISGVLEVIALAWWAWGLVVILWTRRNAGPFCRRAKPTNDRATARLVNPMGVQTIGARP